MSEAREESLSTADLASAAETERPSPQAAAPERADTAPKPAESPRAAASPADETAKAEARATPLFPTTEAEGFRSRWGSVQTSFVDEPRKAVEEADTLVAEVIKRLADSFASERGKLEGQWERGEDIDTEDLRVALQRYRSFFDRLLSL